MKNSKFLIYRKVLQTILQIIYQYNGIEGLLTILLSNAIMSNNEQLTYKCEPLSNRYYTLSDQIN